VGERKLALSTCRDEVVEVVGTLAVGGEEPEGCKRAIRLLTSTAAHLPRSSEWVADHLPVRS
jgi:hypothetical protein